MKRYFGYLLIVGLVLPLHVLADTPTNGDVRSVVQCIALADGPNKPVDEKTIGKWKLVTYTNLQTNARETLFEHKSAPQKLATGLKFLNPPDAKSDFNVEKKQYCCKFLKQGPNGKFLCVESGSKNSYSDLYGGLTGAKGRGQIQWETK